MDKNNSTSSKSRAYTITEDKVIDLLMHTATREEVNNTRQELKGEIAELKKELKGEITELKKEFKGEIAELKKEFKAEIAGLRPNMKGCRGELSTLSNSFNYFFVTTVILLIVSILNPIFLKFFF